MRHQILNMTMETFCERYPTALPLLAATGIASNIPDWVKMETALKLSRVSPASFCRHFDELVKEDEAQATRGMDYPALGNLDLYALLPCMLKIPLELEFRNIMSKRPLAAEREQACRFDWQDNLGLTEAVAGCKDIRHLPDIIIAVGTSTLFNRNFMEHFVKKGAFTGVNRSVVAPPLAAFDLLDPYHNFTMLAADAVVIVADLKLAGDLPLPRRWEYFLEPEYAGTLAVCGRHEAEAFSPPLLLSIYRDFGFSGLRRFARAVSGAFHPARMSKHAGKGKTGEAPFSAVPLFFAETIRDRDGAAVIWPEDGALAVPMNMLVKKDTTAQQQYIADFFAGPVAARICADAWFPALHPSAGNRLPEGGKMKWIGWDFLYDRSFERILEEVLATFRQEYRKYRHAGAVPNAGNGC
jgi:ABC-type Fe3+ transport system substrate-binding protein